MAKNKIKKESIKILNAIFQNIYSIFNNDLKSNYKMKKIANLESKPD